MIQIILDLQHAITFKDIKISTLFLILALLFGVVWIFIVPPFQSPDEQAHFFRIYQISEGKILPLYNSDGVAGGLLPKSIVMVVKEFYNDLSFDLEKHSSFKKIFKFLLLPLNSDDVQFQAFPSHAYFTPFAYVPQTIAVVICRLLEIPPLIMLYIGRVFNFTFWMLIIRWLIKFYPKNRWLLFVICIMPMHLYLATSLSQDPSVTIYAFFIVTYTLFLIENQSMVKIYTWLLLFIVAFCLCLSKFVYFPLIFLFLLIPSQNFPMRKKILILSCFYFVAIAGVWVWFHLIKTSKIVFYYPRTTSTSQLDLIVSNPLNFFIVNLRTIWNFKSSLLNSFIGCFGWLNVPLPPFIIYPYCLIILAAVIFLNRTKFSIKIRLFFLAIFLFCILALHSSFYIFFNKVGASKIAYLQGRYYIPIIPTLLLTLSCLVKPVEKKMLKIGISLAIFFVLSISTYKLLDRYWL